MDAIELLETRASNGKLTEPAPDDATLTAIVDAALRAPDHGAMRPWKILTLRGEALERLGGVLRAALQRRDPAIGEDQLDREGRKPLRAPLMLIVAATPSPRPGVPEIEQVLSAGALVHGILLGLHARGFAGMWRTGDAAYDPSVKLELGLRAEDHIVAFLYCGTEAQPAPSFDRPGAIDLMTPWP
ncbi:MAG: nitroreductase [Sandaracinaceae bacterium]|nr:nitroreductase [Sandaracinaceae bacterium]